MKIEDLETTYDFVSAADPGEVEALVSRSTGETFVRSDLTGIDEFPEGAEESDDLVELPHRYDLDLGQRLVWDFVSREIPEAESEIRGFFRHRGAYAKFKSYLAQRELLDRWFEFERERTRERLIQWARDEGIPIED